MVNSHTSRGVQKLPGMWSFLLSQLKPRGKMLTPFNVISVPIMLAGVVILYIRFTQGLGATTNLSQTNPWGIWIGFDVVTGVAFAGGAYVITFIVYVMKMDKYHPIVRATVLNGFLAYLFYAGALVFDLGRPWHVINPIIGNAYGYNSVMFIVAWHFMLYMLAELIEFSPAIMEWLGLKRARRISKSLTLFAVIFGASLSVLHQAGLGALFLMAKPKIHPLWYTEFLPVFFVVSSIFAGLSMVILESSFSHRVFKNQLGPNSHKKLDDIIVGLARGATITMFLYYFFKALTFLYAHQWEYLDTGWGAWYLVEILGFVLVPMVLYAYGARHRAVGVIKIAAALTLVGILMNRINVSVIAFNWNVADVYIPHWMEVIVTLTVVFAEIWVLRWVINRMPVLREPGRVGSPNREREIQSLN
jgi:Ni/Fe-hydrogenase subunit HybB-like protein